MIRLGILYKTIDEPYGGVNTFFRNFLQHAEKDTRICVETNPAKADIILSACNRYAPEKMLKPWHLRNLSEGRNMWNPFGLFPFGSFGKKAVFRVDGLRGVYSGSPGGISDKLFVDNMPFGRAIVFQSDFSKFCFDQAGYEYPALNTVIHNGANGDLFYPSNSRNFLSGGMIRIVTSSWSTNTGKGFEVIKAFSEIDNVEILHIGRWPEKMKFGNVKLLGLKKENDIADILRSAHFFLFPSKFDACPNSVVEALACGIPVIYHQSGGTPELCKNGLWGISFDDACNSKEIAALVIEKAVARYTDLKRDLAERFRLFTFEECYSRYINFIENIISID